LRDCFARLRQARNDGENLIHHPLFAAFRELVKVDGLAVDGFQLLNIARDEFGGAERGFFLERFDAHEEADKRPRRLVFNLDFGVVFGRQFQIKKAVEEPVFLHKTDECPLLLFLRNGADERFKKSFEFVKEAGGLKLALQDRGFKVALVTDGRMSGASGKVLAAIHVTPEAAEGGPIAKVRNGDVILVDGAGGALDVVAPSDWRERAPAQLDLIASTRGLGRELFSLFRANACSAEHGGTAFPDYDPA